MGEIADALRRANQAVEAGSVEPEPTLREPEEPAGEIAAALNRADAEVAARLAAEVADRPRERAAGADDLQAPLADNLARTIFHVERHRHLGLRLRAELERGSARSLAVVSALRNEGKSIVSCNLAAAIASLSCERSVALVDLDLRSPSIAKMLELRVKVGVELVLQGRAKLDETRISLRDPEIDVYACDQPHRAAHELLVLPAFESFIRDLEARYAVVIIDTPPTLLVPDSNLIMRRAGFCVGVARAGTTRVHRFTEMLDRLPREKILGKVINNVPLPSHTRGDDYYYYANEESE